MWAALIMGVSVSLIAAAIYDYTTGNHIRALVMCAAGLIGFIVAYLFNKKKPEFAIPQSLMKDSGNATASATGGAGGHASIGDIVLNVSPAQSVAAAPVTLQPPRSPEIQLIDCKPTMIGYNYCWEEIDPLDVKPDDWKPNAFIALFRVKPTAVGEKPLSAHNATAHLTYRNSKGETQVVDYGTWLGKYEHKVDFRGNSHALVLSSTSRAGKQDDGQTYVFDNPNSFNIFESHRSFRERIIEAPSEKILLRDCTELEVEIRNFDTTLFRGKFKRTSHRWEPI